MKSYCIKQRKQTECVPGSEEYVVSRNGRNAMKCICAECGITKFKFVKGSNPRRRRRKGSGLISGKNSPLRNIPLVGAIL